MEPKGRGGRNQHHVFEIAGLPCRVASDDQAFWSELDHYGPFQSQAAPVFSVEAVIKDPPAPLETRQSDGPYAHLDLCGERLFIAGPGFEGSFDFSAGRGTIVQPCDPSPFETFLTAILGWYLRRVGGFFLHSAALQCGEKTLVFFGPSGSGKTTLATVVGEGVLSDEIVAVRREGAGYRVHGLPWRGSARSGTLSGCFALQKASVTEVCPLTEVLAVRRLLPSIFYTTPAAEELGETFRMVSDLVAEVPCFDLRFTPDRSAWERSLESVVR